MPGSAEMEAPEALVVGTRVLARREPDLEPEEGVVKKVHSRADGCTAFHVRLVSGRDAEGAAVMGRSVESAGDLLAFASKSWWTQRVGTSRPARRWRRNVYECWGSQHMPSSVRRCVGRPEGSLTAPWPLGLAP